VQVYLAPTWDKSDMWIASMRHIAREGRVYVIACCQALHRDHVPARYPFKDALPANLDWLNVGNSVIVDPDGAVIAGPVAEREDILYAEIDPSRASGSRWIFDVAGHYQRPDLFSFEMKGAERGGEAGTSPDSLRARAAAGRAAPRRARTRTAASRAKPARAARPRRSRPASRRKSR